MIAAAVSISNSVGSPCSLATIRTTGRSSEIRLAKSASEIGSPSTWTRSVYDRRCGLGMLPTRWPAARKIETRSAQTEPLPLVPATSTPRMPSSGAPRASSSTRVRVSPSLIPNRPVAEM